MSRLENSGDTDHVWDPDVAVKVCDVSKVYQIWNSPQARLMHPLKGILNGIVPSAAKGKGRWQSGEESYRNFYALSDISLEIKKGESWGFIGVNGSGKSTLLKIISGNLRPSSGKVMVDGKVGIVDYNAGINGEFTGRENIFTKAAVMGLSEREIKEKMASIEEFAEIGDFMDQPTKTYSSGMCARLGFAIMAHMENDILISDEALAVGDAFFVQKCMAYIRSFLERGTFLFVSHSIDSVRSLCDKAVWLDNGKIRAIGSSKEVANAYMNLTAELQSENYYGELEGGSDGEGREAVVANGEELARLYQRGVSRVVVDPRQEMINRSNLRNEIEIDAFEYDQSDVGSGGAEILDVSCFDEKGRQVNCVIGGEVVTLKLTCGFTSKVGKPILGFQLKDHLGQELFGDNTYLVAESKFLNCSPGTVIEASFEFQMPLLQAGEYVVTASVADGDQESHALVCSRLDAMLLRCSTSAARFGKIGIPMISIGMEEVILEGN